MTEESLSKFHPWLLPAIQKHDAQLWDEFHRCKDRVKFTLDDYRIGLTGDMGSDHALREHIKSRVKWEEAKDKLVRWNS